MKKGAEQDQNGNANGLIRIFRSRGGGSGGVVEINLICLRVLQGELVFGFNDLKTCR